MIIQVGPFPPPIGGISMFIKRMKMFLEKRKLENTVWNIGNTGSRDIKNKIIPMKLKYVPLKYLSENRNTIIHYHISGEKSKIYIGLFNWILFRGRKKIITIHGECSDLFDNNKWIMKKTLNTFDLIICVKSGDENYLKQQGINTAIKEIPAYINPLEDINDFQSIPKNVKEFIENSNFLISANGCIRFYHNEDLYGLDMLVEMMKALQNKGYKPQLLFALLAKETQTQAEKEHYRTLKELIKKYGLENDVFIYEVQDTEFYPILIKSKLFIRATNTDGDAVSLREALYFKIPSLASDIVTRPEGTVLFEARDQEDLEKKVIDMIVNYKHYRKFAEKITIKDYSCDVLNEYQSLLQGE